MQMQAGEMSCRRCRLGDGELRFPSGKVSLDDDSEPGDEAGECFLGLL